MEETGERRGGRKSKCWEEGPREPSPEPALSWQGLFGLPPTGSLWLCAACLVVALVLWSCWGPHTLSVPVDTSGCTYDGLLGREASTFGWVDWLSTRCVRGRAMWAGGWSSLGDGGWTRMNWRSLFIVWCSRFRAQSCSSSTMIPQMTVVADLTRTLFNGKRKSWSVRWSAKSAHHGHRGSTRNFFIFSLMQPECPDIPNFAHFDDWCFTSNCFFEVRCNPNVLTSPILLILTTAVSPAIVLLKSDATQMSRWLPSIRRCLPTNPRRLPANRRRLPSTFFN